MADKFKVVMDEFRAGTLKTSAGKKVTSLRQAKAIAANVEARERAAAGKRAESGPRKAPRPMRGKDFFLRTGR
jgi:hypothetical protein